MREQSIGQTVQKEEAPAGKTARDSEIANTSSFLPIELAFVKALATRKGISVRPDDSGYAVMRWGQSRHFSSWPEVKAFLLRLGVEA